jgi:hypothetical protein
VTGAEVIALVTGLPAVISAVTALVIAIRGSRAATTAQNMVTGHLVRSHPSDPPLSVTRRSSGG